VRVGGTWTTFRGRRLKVLAAEPEDGEAPPGALTGDRVGTGSGLLRLITVQPEGKAPMSWRDFANGAHPKDGERLGVSQSEC
jgi:methionyl-tRNA formyltransferase